MSWRHHVDGDGAFHVWPEEDLIDHEVDDNNGDCVCGPVNTPVKRSDGSVGWVIVHHSLDGREKLE